MDPLKATTKRAIQVFRALITGFPQNIILAAGKTVTAPGGFVGPITGVASEATTLTGLTASVAELNLLDRTGAVGVVDASKAIVAGAQKNLNTLNLGLGATAASQALGFGPTDGTGYRIMVQDESITIPSAQASIALTNAVPDGAVIIAVQASIDTTVVATTATKVGIGIAGNPDAWGLSADLLDNTKVNTLVVAPAAETGGSGAIGIYACDNAGDAAGTIDSGVVRVRITFAVLTSLPNAA